MIFEQRRFPGQLRYWGLHCTINALPSFIIACWMLELWGNLAAVLAMLLAIGTFVLIYAGVTSLRGPLSDSTNLAARALRLGAKVRLWVSLVSVPVVLCDGALLTPDFWAGLYSVAIVNHVGDLLGHHAGELVGTDGRGDPLGVYCATMLEGSMISVMLLFVAFFSLVVMQIRARRKIGYER